MMVDMPSPTARRQQTPAERTTGRRDRRRALLDGALVVFAADGYSRASIDAIARTAGVSSRTIYNQFGDKAGLFEAVIIDSAERVAAAQIVTVQRYLGKIVDIEADLIEFGRVWATHSPDYAPHFALVRQVIADADHIPEAALRGWQEAGPLRVRREIAEHLRRIAEAGHLSIQDPDIAASHLVQLVTGEVNARGLHGTRALPQAEIDRLVDAGVHAFLHGYAGQASSRGPGRV